MKLFNPGPVNLTQTVRSALGDPDLCHREIEFAQLQQAISKKLLAVYQLPHSRWANVLLSGSGTLAVEAMLTSLIPRNGKVLIIANGVYGERMANMARAHGIEHHCFSLGWGAKIDLSAVEQLLQEQGGFTHMALVHHETTTGRLNSLTELADLAEVNAMSLLVDAVSSFGAEPIPFEHPALAAIAASSNKCLHGAPGLSFVLAQKRSLEASCQPARSVYLDLVQYYQAQLKSSVPFTPAIPAFYALDQALTELLANGGWQRRHQEYQHKANYLAQNLAEMGIPLLLDQEECSVVLRSFVLPKAINYQQLHAYLRGKDMVIYAGQGQLGSFIFRLSTMGQITLDDIDQLSKNIEHLLLEKASDLKQEVS